MRFSYCRYSYSPTFAFFRFNGKNPYLTIPLNSFGSLGAASWESALTKSILSAHSKFISPTTPTGWEHSVVLGGLSSYVFEKDNNCLKKSLQQLQEYARGGGGSAAGANHHDMINEKDHSGYR